MVQYVVTIKYYDFVFNSLDEATSFLNMAVLHKCDVHSSDISLHIRDGEADED